MLSTRFNRTLNLIFKLPCSSLQAKLDILDVATGIRPAARIILEKNIEANQCVPLLIDLGMAISVGAACSMKINHYNYVDNQTDDMNSETPEFVRIYVSQSKIRSEKAKSADYAINDADLGVELGYPECCIKFILNRRSVPTLAESFLLYSSDGLYNPLAWPAASLFDAGIVPHFPCSLDCQKSHYLSHRRLVALKDEIINRNFVKKLLHYNSIPYSNQTMGINEIEDDKKDKENMIFPEFYLQEIYHDFQ